MNGELQSVYCEQCRFADVESDHTRTSTGRETWDDALRRFRTANADESDESGGTAAAGAESDAADTDRDGGTGDDGGGFPDGAAAPESESDRSDVDAEAEEA